jgi:Rhs element Vgr protein
MLDIPGLKDSRSNNLTTFTVTAGGTALGAEYQLESIEIRREVNRVPKAALVLLDGDAAEGRFATSEEEVLVPGAEIEIAGGYASDEAVLFKGVVTRHRVTVGARGGSRLIVEAKDSVFRMALARTSRSFADVSDADVIEALIALYPGLTADVSVVGVTHPQIVQHQASDWDFLVMRAEAAGGCVMAVDGTVTVAPPAAAGEAVAEALFGQGLMEAEIELDAESQLAAVETGAWDPANQELTLAETEDAAVAHPGDQPGGTLAETGAATARLRHPGARDQAALDLWAGAEMARGRRAAARGRATVQGDAVLLPGTLITLGGFGRRFDGTALITGIRHRLGRGDWTTEVLIGGDPRPHAEKFPVAAPPAGGRLPPVPGLQIGVVSALEGDPAGEGRIEVRLPTVTETEGLVWARQALLDAGDGRGTVFRPEIGDEVVLGFLDGDPRDPVILGALHSSAKPAPIEGADDNHEKAIVTRSGMRIHWDDDKVVASVDTPKGNSVVLSEEDGGITLTCENGNTVTLSSDGIALEAKADITLKARGDIKIEGTGLTLKASASVKAEGAGGAELKSSGTTVVKGALVQIN